jgi:membrane fusion protein, copper/silver efflux system
VRKHETLATFYSPEFLSAIQALLFALDSKDRVQRAGAENAGRAEQIAQFNVNLQQFKDSLRNLGMGPLQVEELIRTRTFVENVDITAPADGVILERSVTRGLRFDKGKELYRIADLGKVWVLADVFESEARYLRPGTAARVIHPQLGDTFEARVSRVLPKFDPTTRTLKVRLEADNAGFMLQPDMFVDVELTTVPRRAVVVPADAVVDLGARKLVYVDSGQGMFEPRPVETGARFGDRIEIAKGLLPSETIVVAGTFLIDSESRMRLAGTGTAGVQARDPACGMDVDPVKPTASGRPAGPR